MTNLKTWKKTRKRIEKKWNQNWRGRFRFVYKSCCGHDHMVVGFTKGIINNIISGRKKICYGSIISHFFWTIDQVFLFHIRYLLIWHACLKRRFCFNLNDKYQTKSVGGLIDWLVFNTNFSRISFISWHYKVINNMWYYPHLFIILASRFINLHRLSTSFG